MYRISNQATTNIVGSYLSNKLNYPLIGPTGAVGPTGPASSPTGPTGPSQWVEGTYTIDKPSGPTGFTSLGYTGGVSVFGDLYVSGVIDPTTIVLNNTSNTNVTTIDTLTNHNIVLDDPTNGKQTLLDVDKLQYSDGKSFSIKSSDNVYNVGSIFLSGDSANPGLSQITLNADTVSIAGSTTYLPYNLNLSTGFNMSTIGNPATIDTISGGVGGKVDIKCPTGGIDIDSSNGLCQIGDINGTGNNTKITIDDGASGPIQINALNGVEIDQGGLRLKTQYITTSPIIAPFIYTTCQITCNGATTLTLPVVAEGNVGGIMMILNINASSLSVNSQSSQTIYSSGTAVTTVSLSKYNSSIFMAIQNGASSYGWMTI